MSYQALPPKFEEVIVGQCTEVRRPRIYDAASDKLIELAEQHEAAVALCHGNNALIEKVKRRGLVITFVSRAASGKAIPAIQERVSQLGNWRVRYGDIFENRKRELHLDRPDAVDEE